GAQPGPGDSVWREARALRHGVVRRAGAVETEAFIADGEAAVGIRVVDQPALSRSRIEGRVRVASDCGVEVEEDPAGVERNREAGTVDADALRRCREGIDAGTRRLRRDRERRRHAHLLLLIEDVESLGAQRVPGWTAGDRRAGEGVLVRLRIAPDDEARVGDGGAADVV